MTNNTSPHHPKEQLRSMQVLFMAMISGQLMIALVLFFVGGKTNVGIDSEMTLENGFDNMVIIGIAIFIASASASLLLYNKRSEQGKKLKGTLVEKITHYRSSFILRVALLEGANLTMIIFYFFVAPNFGFMVFFVIGLILFMFARPSGNKIIEDYKLSNAEQNELRSALF